MTTLPDILRGFRPAGEELLRITQCVTEPYAAVDPRHLDVEVAAGGAVCVFSTGPAPQPDKSASSMSIAVSFLIWNAPLFAG